MTDKLHSAETERLYEAILSLKTVEECGGFFEDLCTINEILDMAQRFQAAQLLFQGENYVSVSEKTGMSTATISRVRKCLHYGNNGYLTVLERLNGPDKNDHTQEVEKQ